ncbi:MAG: hypothetical protein IPJ55_05040 [Chloracidobacterium sp.]|nr:hypothetical protein [Chloracidobacterium sp.]
MKILAEKKAIELLTEIRNGFAENVRTNFEHRQELSDVQYAGRVVWTSIL